MTQPQRTPDPGHDADSSVQTGDRRRNERVDVRTPVRMRVNSATIAGESSNLSSVGVLFYSREPIQVTVEIGDGASRRTFNGQLVRLQRVNDTSHGFAVEFDVDDAQSDAA